jgi:hypothetical protein
MVLRFLVIIGLAFGSVSCGVKGDPLPRTETSEEE